MDITDLWVVQTSTNDPNRMLKRLRLCVLVVLNLLVLSCTFEQGVCGTGSTGSLGAADCAVPVLPVKETDRRHAVQLKVEASACGFLHKGRGERKEWPTTKSLTTT